jgi:hypothetical protein
MAFGDALSIPQTNFNIGSNFRPDVQLFDLGENFVGFNLNGIGDNVPTSGPTVPTETNGRDIYSLTVERDDTTLDPAVLPGSEASPTEKHS